MVVKQGREGTVSVKGSVWLGDSGAKRQQEEDNSFAFVSVLRTEWHAIVYLSRGSGQNGDL